jgi:4-hydroxy-tetrahydrodipicolinate synthase
MFERERIRGIVPPVATPLTSDGGLDETGLRRLIDRLIDAGCHAMFMLGGTGEGLYLPDSVYEQAIAVSVDAVAGRVPVLVGVSDTSTPRVIERGKLAARLGADVLIANPPCMGQRPASVVYEHYVRLAGETGMPTMVYNVPPAIPTDVTVETLARLAEVDGIIGMKDSASYTHLTRVLAATRGTGFRVLCGVENFFVASMMAGAVGGTLASANVGPDLSVNTYAACLAGDWVRAQAMQDQLSEFVEIAYHHNWTQVCKHALNLLGISSSDMCTLPLPALTEDEKLAVRQWLNRYQLLAG